MTDEFSRILQWPGDTLVMDVCVAVPEGAVQRGQSRALALRGVCVSVAA